MPLVSRERQSAGVLEGFAYAFNLCRQLSGNDLKAKYKNMSKGIISKFIDSKYAITLFSYLGQLVAEYRKEFGNIKAVFLGGAIRKIQRLFEGIARDLD